MAEKKAAAKKLTPPAETGRKPRGAAKPPVTPPAKQAEAGEMTERQRQAGVMATSGLLHAAAVMEPLQKNLMGSDATMDAIYTGLQSKLDLVQTGDMTPVESMLLSQAMSLQTIYASLARKAAAQEYLKQYQVHLALALKAQAQSRATLEALIELKHPRHPPTFVKQANVVHGHQQVNHTYALMHEHTTEAADGMRSPQQYAQARPHAGISQTEPNRLLEATHETQGMGSGAAATAGRGHQKLAAMGAIDRPQDSRRQGAGS